MKKNSLKKIVSIAAGSASIFAGTTALAEENSENFSHKNAPSDVKISKESGVLDSAVIPFFGAAFHGNAPMWPEQKFGLFVVYVKKNSPADKAGLAPGDVLLTFDEQRLFFPNQFSALVRMCKPGDEVKISFLRDDKIFEATTTLQVRGGNAVEQKNEVDAVSPLPETDDIRIIVNGREFPISAANHELRSRISISPEAITIRMSNDFPEEIRSVLKRFRERQIQRAPKVEEGIKIKMHQTQHELCDANFTFSQAFFGDGNSVVISGTSDGRDVSVQTKDDGEIFSGPCSTLEEIEAIPEEARKIIENFTKLVPIK